jgi:hypothetical protein
MMTTWAGVVLFGLCKCQDKLSIALRFVTMKKQAIASKIGHFTTTLLPWRVPLSLPCFKKVKSFVRSQRRRASISFVEGRVFAKGLLFLRLAFLEREECWKCQNELLWVVLFCEEPLLERNLVLAQKEQAHPQTRSLG